MNLVVRRRLAVSALAASTALVGGVLLAPSGNAATNALSISPSGAVNTDTADVLTFTGKDADFEFGGTATFTRINGGQPFDVSLDSDVPPTGANHKQTATVDFTDPDGAAKAPDGGVGKDGPADAGVYNVNAVGAKDPVAGVVGGGSDNCSSCFTVLPAGPVSVSGATPTSIRPGATVNSFTVAGNNFERGSHIDFLFPDGSVDPLITANANPKDTSNPPKDIVDKITTRTSMKRTAHVDSSDAPGSRGIRVTNLDGSTASCSTCFFVAGPALSSISPTSGVNDPGAVPVTVTFTGPNVTTGTPRLEFTGDPGSSTRDALSLDPISSTPSNGQSLQGTFDLSNAAPGAYQAVVRDKNTGITNACEQPACSLFTVIQQSSRKPPTVTSLDDPNTAGSQHSQPAGTTKVFEVNGTNFSKGVLIKTTATKTTVTAVEFVNPTLVRATITTAKDETAGDYNVTATLTDGTASAACNACYTVGANTPSPSASSSPTATGSPCPSSTPASATPTATTSASSTASPTASASASAKASASSSATATATTSPGGSSCGKPLTLRLDSNDVITPGTHSLMTARGTPGSSVTLRCYSRTPENGNQSSPPYADARTQTLSSAGDTQFSLNPGTNTRCFVKYTGSADSDANASASVVQKVATALSLSSYRDGVRKYHFQGTNLPRRAGQLITLYRYATASGGYCVPAPERYGSAATSGSCRAIRTATASTNSNNVWRIDRTFTGSGQFYFVVRTSDNLTNVGGYSNQRLTVIH